jgi:hypothetical protein
MKNRKQSDIVVIPVLQEKKNRDRFRFNGSRLLKKTNAQKLRAERKHKARVAEDQKRYQEQRAIRSNRGGNRGGNRNNSRRNRGNRHRGFY